MVRKCKYLLKNKKIFITNYIQEKKSYLPCPMFFVYPDIFPDYICLYIETSICDLKFSEAHAFKKARPIEFVFRRKQEMIRNLFR